MATCSKSQCLDKEVVQRFQPHKVDSAFLSDSFGRISQLFDEDSKDRSLYSSKSVSISGCGDSLTFAYEMSDDGVISDKGKLIKAYFCKDRLCPMCTFRRSMKVFSQVSDVMAYLDGRFAFIFVTLTVPNVHASELRNALLSLSSSYNRLLHTKKVSKVVKGYFRALEVTYNKHHNTFHPHVHCVWAVPLDYFTSADYISHDDLLDLWRRSCKNDSISQVYIERCRKHNGSYSKSVCEVSKYTVKSNQYLFRDNLELTDNVVLTLSRALSRIRLVAFAGCFKSAFDFLGLEDTNSDNADLLHIKNKINPDLAYVVHVYHWGVGAYQLYDNYSALGKTLLPYDSSVSNPAPATTSAGAPEQINSDYTYFGGMI